MLVCSVVLRPERAVLAATVLETAAALDDPSIGALYVTLADAPGNALDILVAFVGQNIREDANATATVDGLSAHPVTLLEEISAAVSVQDSAITPATIWATFDPAMSSSVTLSGGNLIATNTAKAPANQGASVASTAGKATGKYYFEATFITITGGANLGVGVGTTSSTYSGLGNSATTGNNGLRTGTIWANGASSGISVGVYSNTQIAGVAVDLDNRKVWFRHSPSGNWNNNATYNPATNTGGITIPAGTMVPFVTFGGTGGAANNVVAADFGASAFVGTVPSGFTAGWPLALSTSASVSETATANSTQDGTVIPGVSYATWDAATVTAVTLSGGNLAATNTGTTLADQGAHVASTSGKTTGKYYFEVTFTTLTGGGNFGIGVGTTASTYTNMGNSATTGNELYRSGNIWANGSSTGLNVNVPGTGTVASVAVDLTNRKIWFMTALAGGWNSPSPGANDPATNVGGITIPAGTMVPFVTFGSTGGATGNVMTANFGGSSFVRTVPSGFTAGWPV